jgi:(p)ppGpp synthase/HD superfamily hydrolase
VVTDGLPTAVLGARFSEAVRWASLLHADQCRKGTHIAYVSHLLAVASLVLEDGGTEDEAIAGVLHDTMEDLGVAEAEIRSRFGQPIAEIVRACSDGVGGRRDETDWRTRKEEYLRHLELDDLPAGCLRVAAADKLHNARSILSDLRDHGPAMWREKGFHAGAGDQRWYYIEVARVLAERQPGTITRELERVVSELSSEIELTAP